MCWRSRFSENFRLKSDLQSHFLCENSIEDIPFEAACENLRPGQALLLYTDGITEAQNPAGEMRRVLEL